MLNDIASEYVPIFLGEFNKDSGRDSNSSRDWFSSTQASMNSYLHIASHKIGSLIIGQVQLIAAFNYGAHENSIVADPRIKTTESGQTAPSKAMECPADC